MYIYAHGECEPPTAEEWEMIIALARGKRDPNSIPDRGEDPQTGILLMYTPILIQSQSGEVTLVLESLFRLSLTVSSCCR